MTFAQWCRFSVILVMFLLVFSCEQEPKVAELPPIIETLVPCRYIYEAAEYVNCIYRMNPDTQSIMIELGEDTLPDLTRFLKLSELRINCHIRGCFTMFSPEILKLKGIKRLIIAKSSLDSIPEGISRLENLEVLIIAGGGNLRKLPDNLHQLKKLRILDVWRNYLNGDSLDFSGMEALELVIVGDNDRVDLPKLKRKWPKLKIVDYYTGEY